MADFATNQGIKDARIPGIDVPKVSGGIFDIGALGSSIGDAFKTVVGAADMQNQDAIEKRVRAESEVSADIVTNGQYSSQTDINAPAPSESVPKDLETSLKRLEVLKTAYGQGKVNETGYWARLNAVAKELRVKYPNYDEIIDSKFSKITGQVPGNALRNQLINDMDAQAKSKSAADKAWEADLDRWAKEGALPPNWESLKDSDEGRSQIRRFAYNAQGTNAKISQRKSAIELAAAEGTLNEDAAYKNASTVLEERTNSLLNTTLSQVGGSGGMQGLMSLIVKAKADNVVSPDEQAAITSYLAQIKGSISSALDQELFQSRDGSGKTMASYFKDRKKIEDLKATQLDRLSTFEDMVTNQSYGLLAWNKAYLESIQNGEIIKLQTNDETGDFTKRLSALRQIGGDALMNAILLNNLPKLKTLTDVSTSGAATIGAASGKDAPVAKTLSAAGASPKASKATVDMVREMIVHPDANPQVLENVIANTFGKGEADFLASFKTGDQIKVFKQLGSPEVAVKMAKLGETNPTAYNTYKNWLQGTANRLMSQSIIDLNGLQGEDLQFDGKQLTISKPNTGYFRPAEGAAQRPVQAFLRQHVEDINSVLKSYRAFIEASGQDGDKATKEFLTEILQIDPSKPKEKTGAEKFFEGVGKYFRGDEQTTIGAGVSRRP